MMRKGRFAGPVVGLRFETPTGSGVTDQDGTFEFRDDEVVTVQNAADVPGQRQLVPLRGGDRAGSIAAAGWVPADASGTWPGR